MRAFLCHSKKEKAFVETLANRLKRRNIILDEYCFETGQLLIDEIRSKLKETSIFVLLASKNSLQSSWVNFEINYAQELYSLNIIKKAIVIIIDDTEIDNIPEWMKHIIIEKVTNPGRASRIIESSLNRLLDMGKTFKCLGRSNLQDSFSASLRKRIGHEYENLIILGGLPNVGRRTFLTKVAKDIISQNLGPQIVLDPDDGMDSLYMALIDESGELYSKDQINSEMNRFRKLNLKDQINEIALLLTSTSGKNELPTIIDNGALTDSLSRYTNEAIQLFKSLSKYKEKYFAVIHQFRPTIEDKDWSFLDPIYLKVPPIDLENTKTLIFLLFKDANIALDEEQIQELSYYMAGFPPAVSLSVAYAKQYTVEVLFNDKQFLSNLQIKAYAPIIEKLILHEDEKFILKYIAENSAISYQTLQIISRFKTERLTEIIKKLINFCLIYALEETFIIASPIKSTVNRVLGRISPEKYNEILSNLKTNIWDIINTSPRMDVIDCTIQASIRSEKGINDDFKSFVIPSMLLRNARDYYNIGGQKEWIIAKNLLENVLKIQEYNRKAASLLCKTYIRLAEWDNAKKLLQIICDKKFDDCLYLKGFFHWKRYEFEAASKYFKHAIDAGNRSVATYHGLIHTLIASGRIKDAKNTIESIKGQKAENPLLLDLSALIYIKLGQYDKAIEKLDLLKRAGDDSSYNHRMSIFYSSKGFYEEALSFAEKTSMQYTPRFENLSNLADIYIELSKYDEAQNLIEKIEKKFGPRPDKKDVVNGLKCKLYVSKENWKEASRYWRIIEGKDIMVHQKLRCRILHQIIHDTDVGIHDRNKAKDELDILNSRIDDALDYNIYSEAAD
ncbi:MAG: TIR domain-containing protein [Deltaproteobacteria bacterium]|nr:TIR domain-containing protein [Deltaproteobacteria bacterium]